MCMCVCTCARVDAAYVLLHSHKGIPRNQIYPPILMTVTVESPSCLILYSEGPLQPGLQVAAMLCHIISDCWPAPRPTASLTGPGCPLNVHLRTSVFKKEIHLPSQTRNSCIHQLNRQLLHRSAVCWAHTADSVCCAVWQYCMYKLYRKCQANWSSAPNAPTTFWAVC